MKCRSHTTAAGPVEEERHVGRPAFGQPGLEERRDAVAGRGIGDGYAAPTGERAQDELEVPLLDARPHGSDLKLLPSQGLARRTGRAGRGVGDGYSALAGEPAQDELEVPLLDA